MNIPIIEKKIENHFELKYQEKICMRQTGKIYF